MIITADSTLLCLRCHLHWDRCWRPHSDHRSFSIRAIMFCGMSFLHCVLLRRSVFTILKNIIVHEEVCKRCAIEMVRPGSKFSLTSFDLLLLGSFLSNRVFKRIRFECTYNATVAFWSHPFQGRMCVQKRDQEW